MKKLLLVLLLGLSSCGIHTGEGTFTGRLVDIGWEGIIFKSCEMSFQLGEQSSNTSRGSTTSKELCDKLTAQSGQVLTVHWDNYVGPCLRTDTCIIIKE
jgi:hypothetical protein